jgi:hypothetical protein
MKGIPWRGPRTLPLERSASSFWAIEKASGLNCRIALEYGQIFDVDRGIHV